MSFSGRTLLLSCAVLVLAGCPKQTAVVDSAEASGSGEVSTTSAATEPARETRRQPKSERPTTTLADGTVVQLEVSEDGRVQQTDSSGRPVVDPAGAPVWEPTPRDRAVQLLEEALVLRKGVAGGPPNLMSAADRLREAVELAPDLDEAHFNLGLTWLDLNLLEDALREFEALLERRKDLPDLFLAMGVVYERLGRFSKASMSFGKGLKLSDKNVDLLNGQARVLLKEGRVSEAVDASRAVLRINSNSIDAFNTLGLAYLEQGEFERSRFVFMKAQTVEGGGASAPLETNLGLVYYRMGREFDAEAAFNRALALNPKEPGAMVNLAHLRLKNLDYEGARTLLAEAATILPGNLSIQLNLAVSLRGTGALDRAQRIYEELAAEPDGPFQDEALLNLAILQGDDLKDYDAALATYAEYVSLREKMGAAVGEDDVVHGYIKEIKKLKKRRDRKRQKEADKARKAKEAAEKAAAEPSTGSTDEAATE